MKIIVIGASGFIGAYLVEELIARGHEVVPAGRSARASEFFRAKGLEMVPVDVGDAGTLDVLPADADAVVNLSAVIPAADPTLSAETFLRVNTLGAFNTMKFCVEREIATHVLTTSHFAVEGHWGVWDAGKRRIDEAMGVNFLYTGDHTAYIVTKVAAEEYGRFFREEHGLRSVVLRLSGVRGYGRYESGFEFFVRRSEAGADIEVFGDPTHVWDNIYVKDATRAIALGVEKETADGLYFLSSGIPLTLREEVDAVMDVFGPAGKKGSVTSRPDKPGGIGKSYVYDISRLERDAGFTPKFPLNARHTLEDYRDERRRETYGWLREEKLKVG